ncbi:MCE family protein [Mycolicibacterium sp. HK-90]|uniref:MCE family protein n=1 Tax=Mycolicibacterium sp. HK-90 TaxID=3056937 RepID=UPI00265A843F|nr:MCE family protein [Mycolicibacterium sp. HK-90]WKG04060.1 MCE family protein [Mycolicibacterium sp. HK-90]
MTSQVARLISVGAVVSVAVSGCAWHGVNSLPLPGAPGRVADSSRFIVEMANVASLESNSPVMMSDVTVGSIGAITVQDWHANVEIFVKPGIVVPANVVAAVGQTSLLGSSHLALNPPVGTAPEGQLAPGAIIPLNRTSTYPTTEQTLASVTAVVNGGGLGQIGDIIHTFNEAFDGNQDAIRELITRIDNFIGVFDNQRADVVATIHELNRLAGKFSAQRGELTEALAQVPPALDVLLAERDRFTTALDKLRVFSDTATGVITTVKSDLIENLTHLEPSLRSLADVGKGLDKALAYATVFPNGQSAIDNAVRGDFLNESTTIDLTVPRLKRELLAGTRWGDPNMQIQAAVGDPGYAEQTGNPLTVGLTPTPAPEGQPQPPAVQAPQTPPIDPAAPAVPPTPVPTEGGS